MRVGLMAALTAVALAPNHFANAASAVDALPAIAQLETTDNYSWKTILPGGFGTTVTLDGQTEQGGFTVVRLNSPGGATTTVAREGRAVIETPYGWLTTDRVRALRLSVPSLPARTPVQELQDVVAAADRLAMTRTEISGTFGAATAQRYWLARMELSGGKPFPPDAITPRGLSAGFRIWLKAGTVTGYEVYFEFTPEQGCFGPRGLPPRVTVSIPTDIIAVDQTKVDIPADARAALDEL